MYLEVCQVLLHFVYKVYTFFVYKVYTFLLFSFSMKRPYLLTAKITPDVNNFLQFLKAVQELLYVLDKTFSI